MSHMNSKLIPYHEKWQAVLIVMHFVLKSLPKYHVMLGAIFIVYKNVNVNKTSNIVITYIVMLAVSYDPWL